jgi:hypothetical protein
LGARGKGRGGLEKERWGPVELREPMAGRGEDGSSLAAEMGGRQSLPVAAIGGGGRRGEEGTGGIIERGGWPNSIYRDGEEGEARRGAEWPAS